MAAPRLITVLLLCATLALAKNEALPPVISPVDPPVTDFRPRCVPVPPVDLAYSCTLDSGDDVSQRVYWVIGDYQVVDRIEFRDFGVLIIQNSEKNKEISIAVPTVPESARIDHGTTFLFDYLANSPNPGVNNTLVTISCVSIQDEINILRAEFDIKLYRAVPPVEQPEWEVTSCNSDGSLSLTITYQSIPPADICAGSDVSYSLSLTNDGVCDSLVDDGVQVVAKCQVKDTAGLKATMTACVTVETEDDVCIDTITELTEVTCNRASIIVPCKSGSDGQSVMQARLDCDLVEGASEEWGCMWETGDTVVDLFKEEPIRGSQARPVGRPGVECPTKDGSRAQLKSLWWWS